MQQIDDVVEPSKVPLVLGGLEERPGEYTETHNVDAGLFHQAYVFRPDFARPLFGVVVATESETLYLGPAEAGVRGHVVIIRDGGPYIGSMREYGETEKGQHGGDDEEEQLGGVSI